MIITTLVCLTYALCWLLSLVGFCKLARIYAKHTVNNSDVIFYMSLSLFGPLSLLACFLIWFIEKPHSKLLSRITKFINEKL